MKFKKRDFLFLLAIIIVTGCLFLISHFNKADNDTVFIYYNSEIFTELPLNENAEIDVNGTNTVVIENGEVYMKNASCPDKLCIKQGKIKNSSKNIICLPNKVTVKTDKKSDVDITVQ